MKLTVDLNLLFSAVEKMGAAEIDFNIKTNAPPLDPIDTELTTGIDVSFEEIDFENGLASYKGRQILLYIRDHAQRILEAIDNPSSGNKFHISDCRTLKEMKQKKRFDRYVVTNDLSGVFSIEGFNYLTREEIKGSARLNVCKNCLSYLNYQGYQVSKNKQKIFNDFTISLFFDSYSSFFSHLPSGIAAAGSVNYTSDWENISKTYKIRQKYCCENCGVNLEKAKNLLHVHHKNGVKSDNSPNNLKALCIDCHKKQPNHAHIPALYCDTKKVNMLRQEQNILSVSSWKDVYRYVDVSLDGLVTLLKEHNAPLPTVAINLDEGGKDHATTIIDLAWKEVKVGIAIDSACATFAKATGWKIFSMAECLDDIIGFAAKLKNAKYS